MSGNAYPPLPLQGALCRRGSIVLGWPTPDEFGLITALRNRPAVRRWFLDDRPLDPQRNEAWLSGGMDRPREALLSIRWEGAFVGTAGWADWDPQLRRGSFGRLALDRTRLSAMASKATAPRNGIAVEATLALRDYGFSAMALDRADTWYVAGNAFAARVNRIVGMVEQRRVVRTRPGGAEVGVIELSLDRARWLDLVERGC